MGDFIHSFTCSFNNVLYARYSILLVTGNVEVSTRNMVPALMKLIVQR